MWVIFPLIVRILGCFHHRVVRIFTGWKSRRRNYGTLFYLTEDMTEAVLQEVETYIVRHQNMDAQYIATRPIINLCL